MLKCIRYAGQVLESAFGKLEFDVEGILKSTVAQEVINELSQIAGFEVVETTSDKVPAKEKIVEETPVESPESKEEEAVEEPVSKVAPKGGKTTNKK